MLSECLIMDSLLFTTALMPGIYHWGGGPLISADFESIRWPCLITIEFFAIFFKNTLYTVLTLKSWKLLKVGNL